MTLTRKYWTRFPQWWTIFFRDSPASACWTISLHVFPLSPALLLTCSHMPTSTDENYFKEKNKNLSGLKPLLCEATPFLLLSMRAGHRKLTNLQGTALTTYQTQRKNSTSVLGKIEDDNICGIWTHCPMEVPRQANLFSNKNRPTVSVIYFPVASWMYETMYTQKPPHSFHSIDTWMACSIHPLSILLHHWTTRDNAKYIQTQYPCSHVKATSSDPGLPLG